MTIEAGIFSHNSNFSERYVPDHGKLEELISHLKGLGLRIVFTQGVFDLVHLGHLDYLEKARSYGDILVVAVDSDEWTKKRKGPGRPIVPEGERLRILTHARSVDIITLINKGIQHGLIQKIRPDTLVVSETTADFSDETLEIVKGCCGKIIKLPPQGMTSTSARVRMLAIDGAKELASKIEQLIGKFLRGEAL